jgi:hypothetical protein
VQSALSTKRARRPRLPLAYQPSEPDLLNEGCDGMVPSVRVRVAEYLLAISAIVLTYLVAEAGFSLVGLRYIPLRLHGDLPEDVRVFAQSSKSGVVPRDPVLLLGDSYAQGLGDWLLETDPNRNGPFHSAHVINTLTGRDVVTLGVSGAGSVEGMAAFPEIAYANAKDAWYLRLPPPHVAVVYFYEGNDLNDNMRFLARRVENLDAADLVDRIDRSIVAYPSEFFVSRGWWRHFTLLRFLTRIVRRIFSESTESVRERPKPDDFRRIAEADEPNIVEAAGQAIELPANLQSPAMELTRPEMANAALVFERSLVFLHKLLPHTPVLVAYLPSPLSSYRLLAQEVSIQRYVMPGATRYPKEQVAEYSNAICLLIRAATIAQGAGFLDLRPAIRTASGREILHGPRNFKHFNRKGMEVLGQTVAERLNQPLAQESCANYR